MLDVPAQAWWIVGATALAAGILIAAWLAITDKLDLDRINSFFFPEREVKARRGYPNAHGIIREIEIPVEGSAHGEVFPIIPDDEGIVESRDERGRPIVIFTYRGPSHTRESVEVSWHSFEIAKLKASLTPDVIRYRIFGKDGRDQRSEEMQAMQRIIDRQGMALALAEEKLDELGEDMVVQKIRKVQRNRAVARAGSMEAQGRDSTEGQDMAAQGEAQDQQDGGTEIGGNDGAK